MRDLTLWLAVAAGGSIGATMRYAVSLISARAIGVAFPWNTLFVNITGSFAMGVLTAWLLSKNPESENLKAFWAIGVLGAFTTFSAFSLDIVNMVERKAYAAAGGYLMASVMMSITALVCGLIIGRAVL
ncbi:fluoride efflux transporter CrcB [Parvularcula sp. IMCC14364]|uniref:fluoride efflux transporter CrcB n=1 Tax=Parvularcula sp. IMCC14364 TaxID=3067902 RepID=UPI002742454C|nr:fluoride efflux transporter CrcB [Parvularcula sp. IMCC14364]